MDNKDRYHLIIFTGAGVSKESNIPTFSSKPWMRFKLTRSYANKHPEEYAKVIAEFVQGIAGKEPNAAHHAIAELNVPVLTMNVDNLHQKAGSNWVINLHGSLPDQLILYGDKAPAYTEAIRLVKRLMFGNSYFLIIGVSGFTAISGQLEKIAKQRRAKIIKINDKAGIKVPEFLNRIRKNIQ